MTKKPMDKNQLVAHIRDMGKDDLSRLLAKLSPEQQLQIATIVQEAKLPDDVKETLRARLRADVQNMPSMIGKVFKGLREISEALEDNEDGDDEF